MMFAFTGCFLIAEARVEWQIEAKPQKGEGPQRVWGVALGVG
jgi:hypothetical protein